MQYHIYDIIHMITYDILWYERDIQWYHRKTMISYSARFQMHCFALRQLRRRYQAWPCSWLHWREKLFPLESGELYPFWATSSDAAQQARGRSLLPAWIRSQPVTNHRQISNSWGGWWMSKSWAGRWNWRAWAGDKGLMGLGSMALEAWAGSPRQQS